jgi:hypothetical protein
MPTPCMWVFNVIQIIQPFIKQSGWHLGLDGAYAGSRCYELN